MRGRIYLLGVILWFIIGAMFLSRCSDAQGLESTWSLLYRYPAGDGQIISFIINANFLSEADCQEAGRLLRLVEQHEHSEVECLLTYSLTQGDNTNGN